MKRLELLREPVPGATRVAVLLNPAYAANADATSRDVEAAARAMGLQIYVLNASTSREINLAFSTFVRERPDALFVSGDPFLNSRRVQLAHLASRHAIPATFPNRDFPKIGGLMSYGANITDAWRQVGVYVGRILNGAKPADLPAVQASKFELVINGETARMLGLTVSPSRDRQGIEGDLARVATSAASSATRSPISAPSSVSRLSGRALGHGAADEVRRSRRWARPG